MQLPLSQFERLSGLAQSAAAWAATPAGSYLAAREREQIDTMIAQVFGYYALQLGEHHRDLLVASPIATKVQVGRARSCAVRADYDSLPFESSSVDLVVIAHALEFIVHPEALMRESFRVLRPEGQLLVVGFNPTSAYGLRRRLDASGGYPWFGSFVSSARVRDWFSVLGLTQLHGTLVGYAPPGLASSHRALQLWEVVGDRWWPLLGGAYVLQAVKRAPTVRRIRPNWHKQQTEVGAPVNVAERQRTS